MSPSFTLTVNGKEESTTAGNILELLQLKRVEPNMVSVEFNGEILDRGAFPSTPLKPGDKIEFLYFMGGGTFDVGARAESIQRPPMSPRPTILPLVV